MLIPEGHRVLVKPEPVNEKTDSGLLYKPDRARDVEARAQTHGKFIDCGPNTILTFNNHKLKKGDKIVFVRYAGIDIIDPEDDEVYWIMNDEDVLAVETDSKKGKGK